MSAALGGKACGDVTGAAPGSKARGDVTRAALEAKPARTSPAPLLGLSLFHSGDTKPFKQRYSGYETVVVLDAFL